MAIHSVAVPVVSTRTRRLDMAAVAAHLPLPVILAFQSVIALLALRNSAFQDEALYLFAGRQIVSSWLGMPATIEPYSQYFSGFPYLYPVLAGAVNMVAGLEAARLISLACMLGVTACVYGVTARLFNRESAIFAAALFAIQAPVLFISRLATYDAMCLFLLALATVLALSVGHGRRPWGALGLGPLLMLAIGVKYAALLFVPTILAVLALQTLREHNWRQLLLRLFLALLSMVAMAALILAFLPKDVLVGVAFTTTNRVAMLKTPPLILASEAASLGGLMVLLAIAGFLVGGYKRPLLSLLLIGSSLLAPAYHIYKGEEVSLNKHVAFGLFFIAPLAGYMVARLVDYGQGIAISRRWIAGMAICLVAFTLGLQQAQTLYSGWAYSGNVMAALRTQMRPNSGHYFADDYDVARYYLQDVTAPWQWTGPNWFQYTDAHQHVLTGAPAYQAAIADGYFDVVEVSYGFNVALDQAMESGLRNGNHYVLIAKIAYTNSYGPGYYWIWRNQSP